MDGPRYTAEPYFADGSPRRFVGTHRPPIAEIVPVPRDGMSVTVDAWRAGSFDVPLYAVEADEATPA